jgi:hypothetical protein
MTGAGAGPDAGAVTTSISTMKPNAVIIILVLPDNLIGCFSDSGCPSCVSIAHPHHCILSEVKTGIMGSSPSQLAPASSPVTPSRPVAEIEDYTSADNNDNENSCDNIHE